jgi:hypothetical protein
MLMCITCNNLCNSIISALVNDSWNIICLLEYFFCLKMKKINATVRCKTWKEERRLKANRMLFTHYTVIVCL